MHPGGLLDDPVQELGQGAQAAAVAAAGGVGRAAELQAHQRHHCKANWEKKLKRLFPFQKKKKRKFVKRKFPEIFLHQSTPPPLPHPCSWFLPLPRRRSSQRTVSGAPPPTRQRAELRLPPDSLIRSMTQLTTDVVALLAALLPALLGHGADEADSGGEGGGSRVEGGSAGVGGKATSSLTLNILN